MKNHIKYQTNLTCPVCSKKYNVYWKVVNHIRKSKDSAHRYFLEKNEKELILCYLSNKGKNKELNDHVFDLFPKNIFCGISYEKIMLCISNNLPKEELERIRRERISSHLKDIPKTKKHNEKVSESIKKAWKDGKFSTEAYKQAYQKGINNRPSIAGENNPMYGKPSPKGSGRGRGGIREDIGHYVRSSWEANICRVGKLAKREYIFEPESFKIVIDDIEYNYTPDFYFPDKNIYYEVKGHAKSRKDWNCTCNNCEKGREAIEQLRKNYGIKIYLIGKQEYDMIKRRFVKRIKNWEDYR